MSLIRLTVGATFDRSNNQVRIGNNHVILVVGYDTLVVVFPGDLTVKLVDVADVPGMAFNLFSLMAAHKQGAKIHD